MMNIRSINIRPHTLLAIISAMLISLLVIAVHLSIHSEKITTDTASEYSQLDNVDLLLIRLLEIETSAKDYLLSDDENILDSYFADISTIKSLTLSAKDSWSSRLELTKIKKLSVEIDQIIDTFVSHHNISDKTPERITEIFESNIKNIDTLRNKLTQLRNYISIYNIEHRANNFVDFKRIKWVMITLCTVSFSLLFIVFALMQNQQKLISQVAKNLEQENDQLEAVVEDRTRELLDLTSYLTRSSEEEKKRIARDLHDELGALLTAARMDTSWILRNLSGENRILFESKLTRLSETLDKGIELKRQITSGLVPPLLRELGLVEALRSMVEDHPYENQPHFHFNIDSQLPLVDSERELALFRICQESLTNIKKYSNANNVTITLNAIDDYILLLIEDDGIGFDKSVKAKKTHGLIGMRARTSMFAGSFEVNSNLGKGTTIEARIPLTTEA